MLALLAAGLLGACAANLNYREAKSLQADNRADAALGKFQEAQTLDPENLEYRNAYLLARQKVLATHLQQGSQAQAARQRSEAELHYKRVLEIDPANAQALSGMQTMERDARHERILSQAAHDMEERKLDRARDTVRSVLEENPRNDKARELLGAITAKEEAKQAQTSLALAKLKPLSIDFKDATIKQVFDVIARSSGLNILFDKDVKLDQRASISLTNSSVEAAIHYVLLTGQLEQQALDANTILVFPNNAGKLKDYQELVVKTFVLANANAKFVGELIKTMVKSRDVVIDEKLNMVILRDSPDAVRLAEKLVALQDVPEPEVMLEVEILEVARDRLTELGVAWPSSLTLTPLAGGYGPLTLADLRGLSKETVGATIDPLKINARKVDGDTNLLANPRIRVLNREKAKIVIGEKVPSITTSVIATGIVSESATYLDVGLTLNLEPFIYVDNDVTIKMTLEVSNIIGYQTSKQGTTTYNIGTRSVNTMLRLKDGENQVLAGLINDVDRRTANKVPGLGDLPLAGRLFGSGLNDGKKTEIVFSITPRLIRNIQRPVGEVAEFSSGTEGSLRRRPTLTVVPPAASPAPIVPDKDPAAVGKTSGVASGASAQ
ncbi:general secretion pathway protein GspD [Paucibacter sp. TC2R-5]|nr:general secretion pathway protein GspD [Paucibacter sp. TC2R-5]